MGNAAPAVATSRRPYVGCTGDAAWRRAGFTEATIFDVYEIGGVLGSGSFGQVRLCWPVHDLDDGGKYAVKIVDTKSEMFRQASSFISARHEANILRAVKHPHIVDVIDVFEKEKWLFLVLELVTGGELFTALGDPSVTVTEDCVATVGRQLFSALQHLHIQSVVHRDVKAENILLSSSPASTGVWHIKLIDFGLAMRIEQPSCLFHLCKDQEMPVEELICGTAYYCAPEVWTNDYTPKVDVWAAGVVTYLALFGTFPFYDRDAGALEAIICDAQRQPSFKAMCAKDFPSYRVSAAAQEFLRQVLTKDIEARPTAASALTSLWLRPNLSAIFSSGTAHRREPGPGGPTLLQSRPVSMESIVEENSCDCKSIPAPIRAKAGRAAARPPVDPNKEQSRTKALEALKRRAAMNDLGSKIAAGDVEGLQSGFSDRWTRSPLCPDKNMSIDLAQRKALVLGGAVLNFVDPDAAGGLDTTLSDSDVDEGFVGCVCR